MDYKTGQPRVKLLFPPGGARTLTQVLALSSSSSSLLSFLY